VTALSHVCARRPKAVIAAKASHIAGGVVILECSGDHGFVIMVHSDILEREVRDFHGLYRLQNVVQLVDVQTVAQSSNARTALGLGI
jgi:hypothetical protein